MTMVQDAGPRDVSRQDYIAAGLDRLCTELPFRFGHQFLEECRAWLAQNARHAVFVLPPLHHGMPIVFAFESGDDARAFRRRWG